MIFLVVGLNKRVYKYACNRHWSGRARARAGHFALLQELITFKSMPHLTRSGADRERLVVKKLHAERRSVSIGCHQAEQEHCPIKCFVGTLEREGYRAPLFNTFCMVV
jgi:hypothetical protein